MEEFDINKDYPVGTKLSFEGKTIEVVEDINFICTDCIFNINKKCNIKCTPYERKDKISVYFKDITNG